MDKLNKLSLPSTIIIASLILGSFFYASQINKQKSIERQQQIGIEQKKQEQLDREFKEREAKEESERALSICLVNAGEDYSKHWRRECKSRGALTDRCISLNEMTFDEYVKQNNISQDERLGAITDFYKERDECSCRLPLDNADRINDSLQKDKDECFKRYPQSN